MSIELELANGETRARLSGAGQTLTLAVIVAGVEVVTGITLGLTVDGVVLGADCSLEATERREVVESYRMRSGKRAGEHEVRHGELTVTLRDRPTGRVWGLVLRAAADGVAFRYVLPADAEVLGRELTALPFPADARAWLLDYQTWYETPRFGSDLSTLADGDYGFPVLVTAPAGNYVLLTESDIDGRFSGAHPVWHDGAFHLVTADETIAVGPAAGGGGLNTPWRVVIAGAIASVVESTLVDDLAPAADAALAAADWIRPGRAAWSWWSSQYSGAYLEHQKRFADYAADRGWEHVLVDCGWDATWMPELVAHASRRGVQVHVWSSWSELDGPEALKQLALWRSWGVAGIKVDFMESEAQERYRWYDAIIAETARVGLMVNFHGSVIPRGWAKTHPHVVGYEGIRGAEYYVFYGDPLTAAHNVIQPFTRNVVGAMDYTPVTFSAPQRETSDAHELALGVVYESGITHFADEVREYAARPPAETFLAEVAPVWDQTLLLGGTPDSHAVMARRSGDRWFVGGIATGDARTITVDLARLGGGPLEGWTVTDAAGAASGLVESRFAAGPTLTVELARNGGFVAILAPAGTELFRARPRPTRAAPVVEPAVQSVAAGASATLRVTAGATLRLPDGWSATAVDDTEWRIVAPADVAPGAVAVVSAELRHEGDDVAVVSHARLFVPLATGATVLSSLPFLSCDNAVGPVERDLSNGGGDPRDGRGMLIAGVPYSDGLGVSAPSHVAFFLDGRAARFTASVGIDDETPAASATVTVVADGAVLASHDLRSGEPARALALDLGGVTVLDLVVTAGEGATEAHVDWAEARIHVAGD